MARRCKQCKTEIKAASKCTDIIEKKGYCGASCLVIHTREKNKLAAAKKFKAETRRLKEENKSLLQTCVDAQQDVNAMIRAVDEYLGFKCIATGKPISDAGHFYHAGSKYRISWLRYHHANIHGQGAQSNRYVGGGDALKYIKGLENRYDQQYINELEEFKIMEDQGLWPKPTKEDIQAMRKWCREMTRKYKKMTNS